ncbi:hypothetical protein RQP46_001446 [Phenoliferia psychrophenolica]
MDVVPLLDVAGNCSGSTGLSPLRRHGQKSQAQTSATFSSSKGYDGAKSSHKELCKRGYVEVGKLEESALANPTILVGHNALSTFARHLRNDFTAANYSGLGLLTATPLHTTHYIKVYVSRNGSEQDPSLAYKIERVTVRTFESDFRDDFYEDQRRAWLANKKNAADLLETSFALTTVYDLGSGLEFICPHFCSSVLDMSKEEREIKYGAYEYAGDGWKSRLKRKAMLSNVKIKEGMEPKMTEREFSRWEEGLKCEFRPESDPESEDLDSDMD